MFPRISSAILSKSNHVRQLYRMPYRSKLSRASNHAKPSQEIQRELKKNGFSISQKSETALFSRFIDPLFVPYPDSITNTSKKDNLEVRQNEFLYYLKQQTLTPLTDTSKEPLNCTELTTLFLNTRIDLLSCIPDIDPKEFPFFTVHCIEYRPIITSRPALGGSTRPSHRDDGWQRIEKGFTVEDSSSIPLEISFDQNSRSLKKTSELYTGNLIAIIDSGSTGPLHGNPEISLLAGEVSRTFTVQCLTEEQFKKEYLF